MVSGGWPLEVIRSGWGHEGGGPMKDVSARVGQRLEPALPTMWTQLPAGHEEGPPQMPALLVPWSWAPQLPEMWETNVCYLSHPICGIWVSHVTKTSSINKLWKNWCTTLNVISNCMSKTQWPTLLSPSWALYVWLSPAFTGGTHFVIQKGKRNRYRMWWFISVSFHVQFQVVSQWNN